MNKFLPTLLLCSLAGTSSLLAQAVTTDPVGAVNITLKRNSDTLVAVPLTPNPSYSGVLSATSSAGANAYNLDVTGATGWTTNQFAGLHYVRVTSGPKTGMYYTITANTANRLTVDTSGDDLATLAAPHTFKIFRYWTLGTLFPAANAGTAANPLTVSASTSPVDRKTEILIKNPNAVGINISAAASYFFTAANWHVAGTNAIATDTIIYPDNPLIVRQPASVPADVVWSSVGAVATGSLAIPLLTQSSGFQDNAIALIRPLDIRLADSGLDSNFVESTSTSPIARRDELFVFDNTVAGFNKSASRVYFRTGGTWRRVGAVGVNADSDLLVAGSAFTIRKYPANGASVLWTNAANY